ncbi:uncharacterized protein LOC127083072 [Lathyrus oleraceus]|uniref:Uncharacterized protein n=1 Tax=Pisum sativum TaxID=3888 RepID=A0A9D5AFS7_PEA|nr:uncharacterized protein LOC127083072 [Pisum sativum]KAI5406254.1 hypothetical protein KIW84_052845 [Pisum sativum]
MDNNFELANIITIPNHPQDDDDVGLEPKPTPIITKKKNHGPMRALRVALHNMRGNSKKPNVVSADDESNNVWKKLVGSMRPLHLQSNQSPRLPSQSIGKKFDQMMALPPPSPSGSYGAFVDFSTDEEPFSPFSPSPASSRYASAVGLNELVPSDEENDRVGVIKAECNENGDGDEKIDSKAEDFIAQFYHQIRLQRLNSVDRDYEERSERSLGW